MSTSKINQSKSSNSTSVKSSQDDGNDQANKPLAATLMQEFQNLKDKFKNEDDSTDKGNLSILDVLTDFFKDSFDWIIFDFNKNDIYFFFI